MLQGWYLVGEGLPRSIHPVTGFAVVTRLEGQDWEDYLRRGTKAPLLRILTRLPVYYPGGFYVFVYEYERSAVGGEVRFVTSGLTAQQHIKASGILDALQISVGK